MLHALRFAIGTMALVLLVAQTHAQESKAAKATRAKLKQVIPEFDAKEIGLKVFLEDVNRELDKGVKFKIDNLSGISNNSKVSFKGKKVTVEKILNDISDKYEFGWYVVSNPDNNKIDGWIVIRKGKGKERGYEAVKEPKGKQSSRQTPNQSHAKAQRHSAAKPQAKQNQHERIVNPRLIQRNVSCFMKQTFRGL